MQLTNHISDHISVELINGKTESGELVHIDHDLKIITLDQYSHNVYIPLSSVISLKEMNR
ncbi:hypothetical protein [Falsibacillus albus]|uniref:DUF2642 domain-containing protein n=1 Tax=Falsibacillus albus TaxID=2478915 RepID=A0A3L7JQY3_9BACI|nr:hypothetical protein [Falsibacillus albus]RLQ93238.1 hypothetical protein D9X91_18600 [Falsibacillus albus]